MKNTKIVLILLMASAYGHAQQQPNFLFFEQNMGLYNPAATGTQGSFAGIGYRAAWSGIEDAPRATSFIIPQRKTMPHGVLVIFQTKNM